MYQISKQFHFSASHLLHGLPDGHPCGRMHGHNYVVEVVLASLKLDERGFVVDYGDLSPLKDMIDNILDHRHLNDILNDNPTAENLARFIYDYCLTHWPKQITAVRVSETPKTWASYAPPKVCSYDAEEIATMFSHGGYTGQRQPAKDAD